MIQDSIIIYNVKLVKNLNALKIESLNSFLDQSDLCYYRIWKINLTDREFKDLKSILQKLSASFIQFDYDFYLSSDLEKLYCSEFVWMIFNKLSGSCEFKPVKIDTRNIGLDKILKREVLEYIPVDFFLSYKNLVFISSWSK